MKIHMILAIGTACGIVATAHAIGRADTTEDTKAKLLETARRMSQFGGIVEKPGRGKFAFVSAQKSYDRTEIETIAKSLGGQIHFAMGVTETSDSVSLSNAREILSKYGLTVGVILVDDAKLPLSLVAMEERWAMINVAKVAQGAKDVETKVRRLRREASRVVKAIFLNGCEDKNVTAVRDATDLEMINKDPIDGQQLFTIVRSLPSYGLVAPRAVPYKIACQQGWAPAPTNDVQKAIWDKVHALPTEPIKIAPETQKVTK